MPLDPLPAIGLACNIIQFIQLGIDVASKNHEIYKAASETSLKNEELGSAVQRLRKICVGLQRSQSQKPEIASTSNERPLQELAENCRAADEEILWALPRFRVQNSSETWRGFGKL